MDDSPEFLLYIKVIRTTTCTFLAHASSETYKSVKTLFSHTQGNLNAAPDLQFLFGPVILALPAYAHSGSEFTSLVCLTYPQNVAALVCVHLTPKLHR